MASIAELVVDIAADTARFRSGLEAARSDFDKFAANAKRTAEAVAGVFAARELAGWVRSSIEAGDQTQKMADKIGASAEQVSALAYAARLTGTDTAALQTGLKTLAQQSGGDLVRALERAADEFQMIHGAAERARFAQEHFGKAGLDLIPLLQNGSAGLRRMTEEARDLGAVIDSRTARAAEEFKDNLEKLEVAGNGVALEFSASILPNLAAYSGELVKASRQSSEFRETIGLLALPIKFLIQETDWVLTKISGVVTNLTGYVATAYATLTGGVAAGQEAARAAYAQQAEIERAFNDRSRALWEERKAQETDEAERRKRDNEEFLIQLQQVIAVRQQWAEEASRSAALVMQANQRVHEERQKQIRDEWALMTEFSQDAEESRQAEARAKLKALNDEIHQDFLREKTRIEAAEAERKRREDELTGFQNQFERAFGDMRQATARFGAGFTNTLSGLVQSGKFAWKELAVSFERDLLNVIIHRLITVPIFKLLFGPGFVGGPLAPLLGFADGGDPPVGRASLVGERGPELFVPKTAGTVVPLARGGRGGDTFVIDARGADAGGLARLESMIRALHGSIERRSVAAVAEATRRGGAVSGAIRGG